MDKNDKEELLSFLEPIALYLAVVMGTAAIIAVVFAMLEWLFG